MISGSHSGSYEEYYFLGYDAVYSVESKPIFGEQVASMFRDDE
jgi:hypothetical protein